MFTRNRLTILILVIALGCSSPKDASDTNVQMSGDRPAIKKDTFIEFESEIGNTIVCLSQWSFEDKGDVFSLTSPDEQAIINVLTFTVEGSDSQEQFQDRIVKGLSGDWRESEWKEIAIGDVVARKRHLDPLDEKSESAYRVYVLRCGELYHAILVNASPMIMTLNGDFYESVIKTFKGISSV